MIKFVPLHYVLLITLYFIVCLMLLAQLKGFEVLKAIHLDPVPFDLERDLLTPTYKKKRPQLLKYYQVLRALFLAA